MKVNILTTVLRGNFQWNCTPKNLLYTTKPREENKIKGSCEQLMDECILVLLFQNESSCETFHIKTSLIIVK